MEPLILSNLKDAPTLQEGYTCDLKYDSNHQRIWLSRCSKEDGEPFDETVYVEKLVDGTWRTAHVYNLKDSLDRSHDVL